MASSRGWRLRSPEVRKHQLGERQHREGRHQSPQRGVVELDAALLVCDHDRLRGRFHRRVKEFILPLDGALFDRDPQQLGGLGDESELLG